MHSVESIDFGDCRFLGFAMKKILVACAIGFMLSTGSVYAAELLVLPPTVISASCYAQDVHSAILEAAGRRKWKVVGDRPGLVVLEYRHGDKFGVTINVHYAPKKFRIAYVKSFGLNYKNSNGRKTINRKYNKWISTLEKEIRKALP